MLPQVGWSIFKAPDQLCLSRLREWWVQAVEKTVNEEERNNKIENEEE
jgi:hypothetical protein